MNVFELVGTFAIKGLDKTKADISGVSSAAKGSFGSLGDSAKDASEKTKKGFGEATQATNPLIGGIKAIGGAVAAYMSVTAIKDFATSCVNAAAEVSAENSAFEQIMGSYATEAQAKLDGVESATGVVSSRLTGSMTSMTAKFKGLGYGVEEATGLAARGLTIASDASAFWDKSLKDSMGGLNSFINGQYEGGEAIGLFANDTQMAQYAVQESIVGSAKDWANLDEATKQATRLEYAENMMKMSGATGQAAKESMQYANVKANLTEKWRQFKAIVGEPIMQNVVIPAMQAMSGLIDKITPKVQQFAEGFKGFGDNAKNSMSGLGELIAQAETPAAAIGAVLSSIGNTLRDVLIQMLPSMVTTFTDTITQIIGILPTLIPLLVQAAITLFTAIVEALPQILPPLIAAIPTLIIAVVNLLPTLMPMLLEAAVMLFMALVEALPQILAALLPALGSLVGTAIALVPTFLGTLLSAAFHLFSGIVQAVPQVAGSLLGAIGDLLGRLPGAISGFAGSMATAAGDMLRGMVSGIQNAAGAVWDAIVGVCSNALDAVKGFFGIASPSKVFRALFEWVPKGAALGVEDGEGSLVSSIDHMSKKALDAVDIASPQIGATYSVSAVSKQLHSQEQQGVESGVNGQLLERILAILQAFADKYDPNTKLVADTGAVVAWLAPELGREFSKVSGRKNVGWR